MTDIRYQKQGSHRISWTHPRGVICTEHNDTEFGLPLLILRDLGASDSITRSRHLLPVWMTDVLSIPQLYAHVREKTPFKAVSTEMQHSSSIEKAARRADQQRA